MFHGLEFHLEIEIFSFFPGFSLVFRTFSMEFPAGCPWPGQGRPATLRGGGFQADAGSQAVWSPGDPLGF